MKKKEVSYSSVDNRLKKPPGRPQAFQPEEALDRAVELFWKHGYDGVDVEQIARAVRVTKPAIYRAFGDKSTLLLRAVEHYAKKYGSPMLEAFIAEPDIEAAVRGFCTTTIQTATADAQSGCMLAAAILGQSERVKDIRSFAAQGFLMSAQILAQRFEQEMEQGRLPRTLSAKTRSQALIDLLQGVLLRAKAGVLREQLLHDALSYVPIVLG